MGTVSDVLANVVRALHMLLITFVVIVPFLYFTNAELIQGPLKLWPLLILHFTVCVSLLVHWKFNDDTCFLTVVESSLRGIPMKNSFMHSIVSPIYKIQNETMKQVSSYGVPVLMGLVGLELFLLRKDMASDISVLKQHFSFSSFR